MTQRIDRRFYQDTQGNGYEAVAYYNKGDGVRPRGYYVSIQPVEVCDCGNGFLSFTYKHMMHYPLHLVEEVRRKSAKADARAVQSLIRLVNEFFEDRDLVARLCKAEELAA